MGPCSWGSRLAYAKVQLDLPALDSHVFEDKA
jgi:hypothetical protein